MAYNLNNGVTIQHGKINLKSEADVLVAYPIAFVEYCIVLSTETSVQNGITSYNGVTINSITLVDCKIFNWHRNNSYFANWIAIGV